MKKWTTSNGYQIFRVLSGRSNAYLILKDRQAVLVDTGVKGSFDCLIKNISTVASGIDAVSSLILTHTHYDHCQSAATLKEHCRCRIIVSHAAADSTQTGYMELPKGSFAITKLIAGLGRLIGRYIFTFEPFQPDIYVNDDSELVNDDSRLHIIETAGHSADSISLLVDNEIAIAGDALFGVFRHSVMPPYADDVSKMTANWSKLLDTGCKLFLPGHGREITRSRLTNEYERYSRKRG